MKKKVLIVASMAGFIDAFLKENIKSLQKMGYEIHIAGNAKNKTKEERAKLFHDVDVIFHQVDFSWKSAVGSQSFESYKQIRQLLYSNDFELIHCHTPIVGAIVRIAAKKYRRKRNCKVIYTSHGFYFHKGASKKKWIVYYPIEKLLSLLCDAIVTINHEDYTIAKKMFCKRVYHINGVGCDTAKFINTNINKDFYREKIGVKKDDLMILYIGRIAPGKNHEIIIEAMSRISNPKSVFVVSGKTDAEPTVYNRIKKMAEEKNVRVEFIGHRDDVPEVCHCADIGVLPSLKEGLGLAGIEMLASGVPLVTSNVQGIKDYMKNDITGYMCNPHDVEAFVYGIKTLSDEHKRSSMKKECIETAKEFDISVSTKQMEDIYYEILRGKVDEN